MTMRDERQDWSALGSASTEAAETAPSSPETRGLTDIIELMFFAYRDFTGEADAHLADRGFGRAHHRVIYFVTRHPGLPVTELLAILKITKQSLSRVLKQLVDGGYISQQSGHEDRRQRLLFPTDQGHELAEALTGLQLKRVTTALDGLSDGDRETVRNFLFAMISADEQDGVAALMIRDEKSRNCGHRKV